MRDKVLDLWSGRSEQGNFKEDAIHNADEIFMSNIGTVIAPVYIN